MKQNLGAIILAAGKGKRMNSTYVNKVAMSLADKPMIVHAIELLENLQIKNIVVVVGFAKVSVMNILGQKVLFAEQRKRLGTAHAVLVGLRQMPKEAYNIIVLNGDDSAFYRKELIKKLIAKHLSSKASFTFLTIEKDNPFGLGRIVRDKRKRLTAIIEEKDASKEEKKIKEINPGCYIFNKEFLRKYLPKIKRSNVTGEYYLTRIIDIGIKHSERIETLAAGQIPWRGINTKQELEEAERLLRNAR
ncbi:MAG: NTP transferase domain-containing protein [Candidatus Levybacteria bacterium]|nr:NTP transferase domain-containing protein [Candidatus Levybacteria bacterium]